MGLNQVTLNYTNFEDQNAEVTLICIDDYEPTRSAIGDYSFSRIFICFDYEDTITSEIRHNIQHNRQKMHECYGDFKKIQDLVGYNVLRHVAWTGTYYPDVRLASGFTDSQYAEDVYNNVAIEMEIHLQHIKLGKRKIVWNSYLNAAPHN